MTSFSAPEETKVHEEMNSTGNLKPKIPKQACICTSETYILHIPAILKYLCSKIPDFQ